MLDIARGWLKEILVKMRDDIRAGVPVVGLEPSCVSTFQEELLNFFPKDPDAKRLAKQTSMLSSFIMKHVDEDQLPKLHAEALLHLHCHHASVLQGDAEEKLLKAMGMNVRMPETGCCGMAGSFGMETEKYEVSMQVGERVLLPEVRQAGRETMIITNGFSCREQIQHGTDRKPLHLAEVIHMAINGGTIGRNGEAPESLYRRKFNVEEPARIPVVSLFVAMAIVAAGTLLWRGMAHKGRQ